MKKIKIGIIGGSGLEDPKILKNAKSRKVRTPFGKSASNVTIGEIDGVSVCVLSRHGPYHSFNPTKVPYRANIWALKKIGCTHIIATTACGSLREEMKPGDLVFIDQFIDNTKHRILTFYEKKLVHTAMADPFDSYLRGKLVESAKKLGLSFHDKGSMITIEGPRFSTRSESHMFRSWGADLINMSTVPEVILANELGIPYQSIAMVTDYDCWKEGEEAVTFDIVLTRMKENADKVIKLLLDVIPNIG